MPRTCYSLFSLLFLAAVAQAQEQAHDSSKNEVGVLVGVNVLGEGGSSVTTVGIPGAGGALGPGALYGARIMRPWIIEVHFALNYFSGGGTTFTGTYFVAQADYLLSKTATGTPYVFANLGSIYLSGDLEGEESVAGAGVGYRLQLKDPFVARLEARYRRWLDSSLNEYALLAGGGVRF